MTKADTKSQSVEILESSIVKEMMTDKYVLDTLEMLVSIIITRMIEAEKD